MRLLALVLTTFLLGGCSFLNPDHGKPASLQATEPPEVGSEDASGRVLYAPSRSEDSDLGPDAGPSDGVSEHCRVFEQTDQVGPEEIKTNILQGAYKTVDFDRTEAPIPLLQTADHVHLTRLEIEVVAGSDFSFLSWMESYLVADGQGRKLVAWGTDLDQADYLLDLEIDGQADLIDYVQGSIRMEGELRARAPSTKTWMTASVGYLVFTDCEWY